MRNPRAEKWLRDKSASLIVGLTDDVRLTVRGALESGQQAGRNPAATARDIVGRYDSTVNRRVGGLIGLAPHQEVWVRRARRQLETLDPTYFSKTLRDARFDSVVQTAIDQNKPLTSAQIDSLVNRYADRTLSYRGNVIARTEGLEALSAADYESTLQVIATGAAREKDVVREWDSVGDNRVRDTHAKMDGQRVGINEAFVSPSGARLMFPHDRSLGASGDEIIQCRCRVKTVIDWIGAALDD